MLWFSVPLGVDYGHSALESSVGTEIMLVQMFHSTRCWCWLDGSWACQSWACLYQKSLRVSSGSQSVGCWHRLMRRSSPAKAEKLCFFPLTHRVHSLSMLKQSGFGSEDCGSLTFCTIPRYPEKQGKQPRLEASAHRLSCVRCAVKGCSSHAYKVTSAQPPSGTACGLSTTSFG